jgi:hypothetical protein
LFSLSVQEGSETPGVIGGAGVVEDDIGAGAAVVGVGTTTGGTAAPEGAVAGGSIEVTGAGEDVSREGEGSNASFVFFLSSTNILYQSIKRFGF